MKRILLSIWILVLFFSVMGQKNTTAEMLQEDWLNKKAADFVVEKWLTEEPNTKGKFVLLDFWGPSCSPCRKAIPELNEWSKRFHKNLVIIGVAPNKEEMVRNMKEPVIEYSSAIDTERRMAKVYELAWYPMAVLIDPRGIVRWIGYPTMTGSYLTADIIEQIIKQYKK